MGTNVVCSLRADRLQILFNNNNNLLRDSDIATSKKIGIGNLENKSSRQEIFCRQKDSVQWLAVRDQLICRGESIYLLVQMNSTRTMLFIVGTKIEPPTK